jgi:hypothetical protein
MDKPCCSKENKKNKNRLNPLLLPIFYESKEIITNFSLPRKYTSTHDDETKQIFMGIGKNYNQILLSSDEVVKVESQVVGKWIKKNGKYQIHLTVLVSTEQNPQPFFRNKVFCEEMSPVLEGIAFAETALLNLHPKLGRTKIFIHFKSIDPKYDRVEYWKRLNYWVN